MNRFFLVVLLSYLGFFAKAQVNFVSSNLPIISITTNGKTINENYKIVADFVVRDNPSKINKLSDPITYQGKIGIELRGSTSLSISVRKPYSIETREDDGFTNKVIALLGMEKENDWAMIAPYSDKTLVRDAFLYHLGRKMMTWAADFRFADVFVNGNYEGIYMITEKIKQGKNRVKIDKMEVTDIAGDELTGGYIVSFDKLKPDDKYFYAKYPYLDGSRTPEYIIVSPKSDKITGEQYQYIKNWVQTLETTLRSAQFSDPNAGYQKVLDVPSFIDYVILNELSKNVDGYRLSTYFYKDKDSKDTRFHAGPVWDYNLGFGNVNYCTNEYITGWAIDFNTKCPGDYWQVNFWWQKLFNDPKFKSLLKKRWQELRGNLLSDTQLDNTINDFQNTIGDAQKLHFQRYPVLNQSLWPNAVVKGSYQGEIDYLKDWTKKRAAWLDGAFALFPTATDDISIENQAIVYPNPAQDVLYFDLKTALENHSTIALKIFDARGQYIAAIKANDTSTLSFSIEDFTEGLYFYQLTQGEKMISVGKFLKI